jgi:hypothetical protein
VARAVATLPQIFLFFCFKALLVSTKAMPTVCRQPQPKKVSRETKAGKAEADATMTTIQIQLANQFPSQINEEINFPVRSNERIISSIRESYS